LPSGEARVHNSVNELTARTVGQDPQIALTYDDAGNLIQDGNSNGDHQYVWDYRNRLIEVKERQSGNWVTVGEYKYDARTRRILKTVTNKGTLNGVTAFTWGGDSDWQCLEERDSGGDLAARYTYSPGYIDAVAVQERDLNADDDFGDADEVVYYHSNTLFSVYALTDAGEDLAERYRYDAYGAATVLDADWSTDGDGISDVGNIYDFTSRRLDAESDLMQYRYRYGFPIIGRFISRDPRARRSEYSYCRAMPSRLLDPSGLVAAATAIDCNFSPLEAPLLRPEEGDKGQILFGQWYLSAPIRLKAGRCCQNVRPVQVVHTKHTKAWFGSYERPWHIDTGPPHNQSPHDDDPFWEGPVDPVIYPHWSSTVNKVHPELPPGMNIEDHMGVNGPGWNEQALSQQGELCLVCFDNGQCGRVIGCLKWYTYWNHNGWFRELNSSGIMPYWEPLSENYRFSEIAGPAIRDKCGRMGLRTEQ
jgi:RHS repeat-associated protein